MASDNIQVSQELSRVRTQPKSLTLRISRFNPKTDSGKRFVEHKVPYEKWTTVLDAILHVKNNFDHSVAIRYSCRQASCGSCGMKINGRPQLACFTKISELNSNSCPLFIWNLVFLKSFSRISLWIKA